MLPMRRVVLSGGPGAGKTTLLLELSRRGYVTVSESAREVIAERLARGEAPRPDPETFAREILRRDMAKYKVWSDDSSPVFFDRSAVEALGMLKEATNLPEEDLNAQLEALKYSGTVFVLPPWSDIYRTDAERDHSFDHAERVHCEVVRWYRTCGYEVHEVPRLPVEQRADHVLQALSATSDA